MRDSTARIFKSIFNRQSNGAILVNKCVERPSQTAKIEHFEPATGQFETSSSGSCTNTSNGHVTQSVAKKSPFDGGFGRKDSSAFPFFQTRMETCFNRAGMFTPPGTSRPRISASAPNLLRGFPPSDVQSTGQQSTGQPSGDQINPQSQQQQKGNTGDDAKKNKKRNIATAGLLSAALLTIASCADEDETNSSDGVKKPQVLHAASLPSLKKPKCGYTPLPGSPRSLPNLRRASTAPASMPFFGGYVNNGCSNGAPTSYPTAPYLAMDETIVEEVTIGDHFPKFELPPHLCQNRDWVGEFHRIMEAPRTERGAKLRALSEEFVAAATTIGQIIIRERNRPDEFKSIPHLSGKGVAGGEKFVQNSIFFKYAIDTHQLYGGNDEHAMKVAGHELKGGTALMSCGMMLGLNFGLMCLIDYRGYRLIATSSLPISHETIIYGSCDGGHTVHADNEELNFIMEKCCKILNLKGHYAGINSSAKFLYGPCDMEGHMGTDGKFYIIDVSRICPPEKPNAALQGSFLYNLLRPEFVARYPKPLSSDAYSLFGKHDNVQHDSEVTDATRFLHDKVIPGFAEEISLKSDKVTTAQKLIEELHRTGINIRHLGQVRSYIPSEKTALRNIILEELICRVLKNDFRLQMRLTSSSNDEDYNNLAADFFNNVFWRGGSPNLWQKEMRLSLSKRFANCLSEEESNEELYDLRTGLSMDHIFKRLQEMTGVKFSVESFPQNSLLTGDDIDGIYVIEKHMYATPRIEADTAAELARQKTGKEAEALYSFAVEKYNSVLELKPDDTTVMSNLGNVLVELARLNSPYCEATEQYLEQACNKFDLCIKIKPNDYRPWFMLGDALSFQISAKINSQSHDMNEIESIYKRAQEIYAKAYELNPCNPSTLFNWANLNYCMARVKMPHEKDVATRMLEGSQSLYQEYYSYKQDTDVLVNWGCLLLKLSKIKLDTDSTEESSHQESVITNYLMQAKAKFLEAEALSPGISAYNVACVCASLRQEEECRNWLLRCHQSNALKRECLLEDEDLEIYRKSDWFVKLIEQTI